MSEVLPCGHTQEEHETQQRAALDELFTEGNATPLLQLLGNNALEGLIIQMYEEMFIRSKDDAKFTSLVDSIAQQAVGIFVNPSADESDWRNDLLDARAAFVQKVEQERFKHEAQAGIEGIIGEYGTTELPKADDNGGPGQHL